MRILFDIYISCYLQKSTVVLKFCTQYNQCEHNGSVSLFEYIKIEYFDSALTASIYFSKALNYVNFRRTINIFFAFPRRKPWMDENVHE